jgi:undecaprenyl diphosphate synthase
MYVDSLPSHLAIIMDGNGRWAKKRFLPRVAGHKAGADAVRKVIKYCANYKIKVLTLFAFSSENWSRPSEEVSALMQLFIQALKTEMKKMHENHIQLIVIGDTSKLNTALKTAIEENVVLTAKNQGMKLVIALDYGGQWDILQATQKICAEVKSEKITPDQITPQYFEQHLSTKNLPPVDLMIRTSGEQRISNFLLWQLSYAELYFASTYWPDFDEEDLQKALAFYASRSRRFGGVGENA